MNFTDTKVEREWMATDATLRDLFAGMALQGMIANPECNAMAGQDVARNCYRIAEEMLAARKEDR